MLLDLGLFLRENNLIKIDKKTGEKTILHISSSMRGFLFTLACRIGSDPYTWVSQETLAEEMDIKPDAIKTMTKKSVETQLIEVIPNPSDKRKNLYRPASFLINYSQNRREKLSTIDGYGIIFEPKKVAKRPPNKVRKVAKRPPSRWPKDHLITENNVNKNIYNQEVIELSTMPKEHETNIINKQPMTSRKERGLICDNFYPGHENQKLADKTAMATGKTGMYLIRRFIDVMKKYDVKDYDFDKRFREFLLKEMPARKAFKPGINKIEAYL